MRLRESVLSHNRPSDDGLSINRGRLPRVYREQLGDDTLKCNPDLIYRELISEFYWRVLGWHMHQIALAPWEDPRRR